MIRRLAFLLVLGTTFAAFNGLVRAADPSPDEVLKSKGLVRLGQRYVLEGDSGLAEWLRQVRASEKKVQDAVKRRTNLERDIRAMEAAAENLFDEWKVEKEKLSRISKNADVTYNKQVNKVNGIRAQILAGLDQIKKRQATIQTIGDPSDEYVALMLKFGAAIDVTMQKYKALAEDAQVKAAIDKINQSAVAKVALGPSDRLNTELPEIRKLRDKVNSETINFEIIGGVPTVPVTLNGKVQIHAIVDSGASTVTISEKLAKKIGLEPGPGDRKTHVVTADGTINEVHVMVLKSVRLGKFTIENVECVVLPDKGKEVDTLLGGTFLRRFVYRMDLSAGQLKLSQVLDTPDANTVPGAKPAATSAAPPRPAKPAPSAAPEVAGTFTRLPLVGGRGGGEYESIASAKSPLIGFNVSTKDFAGHLVLASIEPVFLDGAHPDGKAVFGHPTSAIRSAVARNGYAVGGVIAYGGDRLDGFKVVFMKMTPKGLNPNDAYESPLLGGSGGKEQQRSGQGKRVIGIYGRAGLEMDSMGLVISD